MRNPKESFPLFIPEYYPSEMIYQALSITKDMDLQGGIKKGKAAFFLLDYSKKWREEVR